MLLVISGPSDIPVPPPSCFIWASSKPEDFGRNPAADRKIGATQPEQGKACRQSEERSDAPAIKWPAADPARDRRGEQAVGAEPDKCLLADRDEARIAGQQVPILGKRQHGEHEEEILKQRAAGEEGQDDQHGKESNGNPGNKLACDGWIRDLHCRPSVGHAREETARPDDEDSEKGDVSGEESAIRD
jgi:hypothetical protein